MTRHKTSSRFLAMLLSLILVIGMMPISVFATGGEVTYLSANGDEQTLEEAYTTIDSGNIPTSWTTGWYVVDGEVTIDSRVTVTGDVKLVLKDGANLTVNGGIDVTDPNSFTVYAQSTSDSMGELTANASSVDFVAGIGGGDGVSGGTITINGGTVYATGDIGGAGIGGGYHGSGGTITINGGTVTATGGDFGSGIGGGYAGSGGTIMINDGTVTATGGDSGTGIGGGDGGSGGMITIDGGIVTAIGDDRGAGIGGGADSTSGETFTTGENGTAVIFASSISDQSGKNANAWKGLIFEGNEGKIYGESYTVEKALTIPEGKTMTVEAGEKITVSNGAILDNDGTIANNGTIFVELGGTYNGPETSPNPVQYQKEQVSYLKYDNGSFINKYVEEYTLINEDNPLTNWTTGWYVVDGEVTIDSRVTVTGDVKLILKDGSNLTVNGGIDVTGDNAFTIYAQSTGDGMGSLTVTAGENDAGIGGGSGDSVGTITINGGVVTANGGRYAAGLGGSTGGIGGAITIHGGEIIAKGGDGYSSMWTNIGGGPGIAVGQSGKVTITNGNVSATGGNGSQDIFTAAGGVGIKTGTEGETCITGGFVNAQPGTWESIGIAGTFSTGSNGNGVIITQNFEDMSNSQDWNGLFFIENAVGALDKGSMYGQTVTPTCDFTVPSGVTLTIEETQCLVVSQGITLKNDGNVVNSGTIDNQGTIDNDGSIQIKSGGFYNGSQPNGNPVQYQIDWDYDGDSVADDTTYVSYDEMPVHEDVTKEQTDKYYYEFAGWSPELKNVTGTTVYTAQFVEKLRSFNVTIPTDEGYTVDYDGDTNIEYGSDFTFTVNVSDGYSKTDAFAVNANGAELTANSDGRYTVNVTADTQITVEGVEDVTAPTATITVNENTFKKFINNITFGIFAKDKYDVTISAGDNGSGLDTIEYYVTDTAISDNDIINHSDWTSYDYAFGINNEGKYIIYAKITDKAGNITFISSDGMILEKTAPTNVVVDTNGYVSGQWTNETVELTVSGSEALSGIERYEYSTDGGKNWNVMTGESITISANTNGTEYVFRSLSKAGNYSQSSDAVVVKIDKQVPAITVTGDTNTIKQSDTVNITANAGLSGVAKVEVSKNGGAAQDITASYADGYAVTENGTYTFTVTNGADVTATDSITYDKLDQTKPEVSLNTHGYTSNEWTNSDVTLTVSDSSAALGTTQLEYKVNDGEWQAYMDAIIVSDETDGTTYTFKATSASGVESDEVSIVVKLDKTVPSGDIEIEENSVKQFINTITFGLFFNKNVDITITGTDNLSGVAAVEYYRSDKILTENQVLAIEDWTAYSSVSETAEDAKQFVYYVKITDHAGNVTYFGSNGTTFDLTAPVIAGVTDGATYYTTQSVTVTDENFASATVNDDVQSDSAFTLPGNVEKTYTIVATDKAGNSTTVTVTMKPITSLTDPMEGITPDNVTSDDKKTVEDVKEQVESIDTENATEDEKAVIDEILDNCGTLIEKIEESEKAGATESIDKVENITSDNVKPEDKDDLTQAKEDLENALENFGDNYTEEERAELEEKLEQIDNALESIEKVEAVQDAIIALPDTVEPDDTETEAKIDEVKDLYDTLTEHEKDLISDELKDKLDNLLAALCDYEVVKGDGSKWEKGSDTGLVFTANGAYSKFTGIAVDGKAVDKENYTAVSGSTEITLKPEFLETLAAGTHTLTVQYTDGEASCEFTVAEKSAVGTDNNTKSPLTGNNSNIMLWAALLLLSGGVPSANLIIRKRKRCK